MTVITEGKKKIAEIRFLNFLNLLNWLQFVLIFTDYNKIFISILLALPYHLKCTYFYKLNFLPVKIKLIYYITYSVLLIENAFKFSRLSIVIIILIILYKHT